MDIGVIKCLIDPLEVEAPICLDAFPVTAYLTADIVRYPYHKQFAIVCIFFFGAWEAWNKLW